MAVFKCICFPDYEKYNSFENFFFLHERIDLICSMEVAINYFIKNHFSLNSSDFCFFVFFKKNICADDEHDRLVTQTFEGFALQMT